jgi:hypothetical protein
MRRGRAVNLEWRHRDRPAPDPDECRDFPQRRDFAADAAVRLHLGAAVPGRAIRDWEIANVWYFPERSLEVVYRVACGDGDERVIAVRFQRPGESDTAFEQALRAAARPEAVLHLRDWCAVGWVFPEDPKLARLGSLLSAENAAPVLSRATGLRLEPAQLNWTLLSYLPGKRCAARLRGAAAPGGFVAKIGEGAESTHTRMQALWDAPERRFGMPWPLACDPAGQMRWESFVSGERIDASARDADVETTLGRIAPALVSLHAMKPAGLAREPAARVLDRLNRKVLPRVCGAVPSVAPAAAAVAAELGRRLAALPRGAPCALHGDLHTANLLVDGTGAAFIDLDNLAEGDAAYDLAMLGTRLILGAALGQGSMDTAGRMVSALPRAYQEAGGTPIPEALYAWYIAANLAGRQSKTCVRHHAPGMSRLVPWLLAVAARTLEAGRFESAALGA